VAAPVTHAQPGGVVNHSVSFPAIRQQYAHLRSEFPVSGETVDVRMASWTPGSYLVREFPSDLDRIDFTSPEGETLRHAKVSKDTWRVQLAGAASLVAEYDIHAGDLSVQTSWVSEEYILLNGASVFLYTDHSRSLPHRVALELPAGVGQALSAMPFTGGAFLARDFDELVDSPIVVAGDVVHRFSADGNGFALVNIGATSLWDGARSARDVQAVVAAVNGFWGEVPFERDYWFFNFLVEHRGGLEHDHSTVMMTSRWQMRDREDYVKWLSLVAHEYFHAWNVRRMRPVSLASYDYHREQYSSSLWLAEGITSYYDNLLLSRARLVDAQEYFKRLAIDFHALELTPGSALVSLRQASWDAWIRHYRPDANSINSTASYYTKGAVLGFVLDTRLRAVTRDRAGLDDVMRLMYRHWGGTPYPEHAFSDVVEEVGGTEVRVWLEPLLSTPAMPDIDEALAWYGLALNRHPANKAARESGQPLQAGFGVNWDPERQGLVIHSVVHGTSGSRAGLLPGDELLAIDGERVSAETLEDRLARIGPGGQVDLLLSRRGRIVTVPVLLQEARPDKYEVTTGPDFGERELRRLESWLGQPLQMTDG